MEDSRDCAILLELLLGEILHDVLVVKYATASAAIAGLSCLHADILFLDLNLGASKPSGLDVLRWKYEHQPDLPTVVVSGDTELIVKAAEMANLIIVRKPYGIEDIKRVIGWLLHSHKA